MRKHFVTALAMVACVCALAEGYVVVIPGDAERLELCGLYDRFEDTAFPVPINLALMLRSVDKDVDFKLPWNRPHSGDYALDELFRWIKQVVH